MPGQLQEKLAVARTDFQEVTRALRQKVLTERAGKQAIVAHPPVNPAQIPARTKRQRIIWRQGIQEFRLYESFHQV